MEALGFSGENAQSGHNGVPAVLEQKTTILWKCLYLLASLKDSSGLDGMYETSRRGEEENPIHGQNTTANVRKIKSFSPRICGRRPLFSSTV